MAMILDWGLTTGVVNSSALVRSIVTAEQVEQIRRTIPAPMF